MKLMITTALVLSLGILDLASAATTEPRDLDGLTPLHVAAGYGDLEKVDQLLKNQADLFTLDSKMGVSVLHKAVYSGNANVVAYLLKEGALIDLQSPSNGNTALHDAIYFKPGSDTRVIEAILKFKPNIAIRNRAGLTPKEAARVLKDDATISLIEDYERALFTDPGRALMKAVKANNLEEVRKLLERPSQPLEELDEQGFPPLMWAAREGFVEIVSALLQKGADPNQLDQWMKANAGHKAAFWGRADTIRLLIQGGLDLNARGGYNGYTALHDAVARGHLEVVKILIQSRARKDIKGHDGKTPIDLAFASGNPEIIKALGE